LSKRFEQLDSIRGVASFTVFMNHIYLVFPFVPLLFWDSPLRVIVNGQGAVMIFFVLSGFVLTLPFLSNNQQNYFSFLLKRIFRIYLPYLIAICLSMILVYFFSSNHIKGLNGWFDTFWQSSPNKSLVIEHLTLISNIHTDAFNTVIWSLINEMRISIIFPFLILIINRIKPIHSLILALLLSAIAGLNDIFHFQISNGFHTSYFDTIHYTSLFIVGILLAKHKDYVCNFYLRLSKTAKILTFIFIIFDYAYASTIDYFVKLPYITIIGDFGLALASSYFIVLSFCSTKVYKILMSKPLVYLGKISYSFYLYHFVVLMSAIHIFYEKINLFEIYLIALITSIIISHLAWIFVEVPSQKLGKKITNYLSSNRLEKKGKAA
jgi:peptidoglycan/LPS O-acetylase OafA/YrhL